jgi:hypothetical protein
LTYQRNPRHLASAPKAVLATVLLLLPASAIASPVTGRDTESPKFFLALAKENDSKGNWYEACYWYDAYLAKERNGQGNKAIKDRFRFCLRNHYRTLRHDDPDFRKDVFKADFRLEQAENFYKEVLRKIRKNYFDPEKAAVRDLFREGLVELHMALADKGFREKYVPLEKHKAVPGFQEFLKQKMGEDHRLRNDPRQAADKARVIADKANDELGLDRRLVIVEFACGASYALDEYSSYINPGAFSGGRTEKTVEAQIWPGEDGVGYLRIRNFQYGTDKDVDEALTALADKGMQVLLLDLRDNPGGSVEVAVEVARRFLPAGAEIGSTTGGIKANFQSYNTMALSLPVYVLINGGTASSAELVAGALKRRKDTWLVGQPTFGKNWIQQTVPLTQSPGGALYITWAQFFVANSTEKTIAPNFPVTVTSLSDPTFARALEQARTHLMVMR